MRRLPKRLVITLLVVAGFTLPAAGLRAAGANVGVSKIFQVRMYTSEVPSAVLEEGQFVRIGVILPPGAKVVKVEAFMDEENHGKSIDDWRECDLENGDCELENARVDRLIRWNNPEDITVTADFWNTHESLPRYGKLKVTFMPMGNLQKIYKPRECWLRTECGFAGWMDQAYKEEDPVDGSG